MHNKVTKGEVILIEGVTMERDVVEALESSWQNAQPTDQWKIQWWKIKQYKIRRLTFEKCKISLPIILNIQFPELKCLILSSCSIDSLQSLSRMYLPELQYLDLSNNSITTIKSMRKCNFPKLDRLLLDRNLIEKISCVYMGQMNWPELRSIRLECLYSMRLQTGVCNMVKLQTKQLYFLELGKYYTLFSQSQLLTRRKFKKI